MTEKEKMRAQRLYDANYDPELEKEGWNAKPYVRNTIIFRLKIWKKEGSS